MRLQKYIAMCGVCSRRRAEELILAGKVRVNDCVITKMGVEVSLDDSVYVSGKLILPESKKYYIMLNKPIGYVSTANDEKNRKTVLDLVKDIPARLYPIGRLDMNTSGLLLLTNDGDFSNAVLHPSFETEKTYSVKLDKNIPDNVIREIEKGVIIDGRKTSYAKIKRVAQDEVLMTIHEGRNRQVRKSFEIFGINVIKLKRIAISSLTLKGLDEGKWRHLSENEIKLLYRREE